MDVVVVEPRIRVVAATVPLQASVVRNIPITDLRASKSAAALPSALISTDTHTHTTYTTHSLVSEHTKDMMLLRYKLRSFKFI